MGRKKLAMCEPMLCCLFDNGYNSTAIAETFGMSRPCIIRRLKDKGRHLDRGNRPKSVCPTLVMCMRECGASTYEIADVSGASKSAVYDVCRSLGLGDIGLSGKEQFPERNAKIRELDAQGIPRREIDRMLGLTRGTASEYLCRKGIKTSVNNTERHEQAMDTVSDAAALYFCDFDVVARVDRHTYRIRCRDCGHEFDRYFDRKRERAGGCPECECREREAAYWAAPKIQMQIHWPAVPYQTKDMDKKRVCQMCGGEFTEREWVELYGAAGNGRLHYTCSPHCANAKSRHMRRNVGTMPWQQVAAYNHTMTCALCGGLVDESDFRYTDGGAFVAGKNYPSTDHKIPIARGGDGSMANSQLAHCKCNTEKGTMTMDEWIAYKCMEVSA